jgi:thiamine pyrophosphokinase
MKRAYIFANGKMDKPPSAVKDIQPTDLVIAADGGTHHCHSLGIVPHAIIGDLDSLESTVVSEYISSGTEVIRFSTHKDETDLELALRFAVQRDVSHVDIIGGMGDRWDMTIANVMLAASPEFSALSIRLLDGDDALIILRGPGKEEFVDQNGNTLSLIPLGGDATSVSTFGLEYPLQDETLFFGSPRGVSNLINGETAWVYLKQGTLLCCLLNREEN